MWVPRLVSSPDLLIIRWKIAEIHDVREEYFLLAQFIQDRGIFYLGSYLDHLCDLMERAVAELEKLYGELYGFLTDNNLEFAWPHLNEFLN